MRREQQDLVANYFKRGGKVDRLPTPKPTEMISDVLDYLKESNFVVYRAPRGEGEPKFVCQGSVVTLQNLVSFANEHRATRQLPPFQLVPQLQ